MCRSKEHGGRRCQQTSTVKAMNSLRAQLSRARRQDNTGKEEELQDRISNLKEAQAKYGNTVSPLNISMPEGINKLFNTLREGGGNPLLVGGTVRDALSGGEAPKDFDIEVHEQDMDGISRTLRNNGFQADMVGQQFGVIKTRIAGEKIDISVPRKDSLSGEGHRGFSVEVDEEMGIEEAASRRDFTINAMMYDPAYGTTIDPYGGKEDLKTGTLRHVSDAFGEDPLRPLRGFQFAARYGLTMAPETAEMCKTLRGRYTEISTERVQVEWGKFFTKSTNPSSGLLVLNQIGWEDTVPGASKVSPSTVDKAAKLSKSYSTEDRQKLMSSVIMNQMTKEEAKEFAVQTIEGQKQQQQALKLAHTQPPDKQDRNSMRKWSRDLDSQKVSIQDWATREEAMGRATSSKVSETLETARSHQVANAPPASSIMGRDVIALQPDRAPGPWVGELVNQAKEAEDQGEFETHSQGTEWLKRKIG